MQFDLSDNFECIRFDTKIQVLKQKKALVDLSENNRKRSISQNNSIHLYCKMIADTLNDLGCTFTFKGLKGMDVEVRYTMQIVKETVWRPIQLALFNKESTKDLTTKEVTEIATPIEAYFAQKGLDIPFPNKEHGTKN